MSDREIRSEQQERLELADQPAEEDPRPWREADPDLARESDGFPPGRQLSLPDETPLSDTEPDEIAKDGGTGTVTGPEQQAVHVVTGDERVGD
jgi:hypothetical protein